MCDKPFDQLSFDRLSSLPSDVPSLLCLLENDDDDALAAADADGTFASTVIPQEAQTNAINSMHFVRALGRGGQVDDRAVMVQVCQHNPIGMQSDEYMMMM